MTLLHRIGQKPIIAALRTNDDLDIALDSGVDNLFFMGGSLTDVIDGVRIAKERDKGAFVHLDLIRGLSSTDKESVELVRDLVRADGIVTPKSHLIKEAKQLGLYGVLHLFVLDSLALSNGLKLAQSFKPDAIELMPGIISKVVRSFAEELPNTPIIASGLIQSREEASEILNAGATSLSVSERTLWGLRHEDLFTSFD